MHLPEVQVSLQTPPSRLSQQPPCLPHPNTLLGLPGPFPSSLWHQRFYFCLDLPSLATVSSHYSRSGPGCGLQGERVGKGHTCSRSLSNMCTRKPRLNAMSVGVPLRHRGAFRPQFPHAREPPLWPVTVFLDIWGKGHESRLEWTGLLKLGATLSLVRSLEHVISRFPHLCSRISACCLVKSTSYSKYQIRKWVAQWHAVVELSPFPKRT